MDTSPVPWRTPHDVPNLLSTCANSEMSTSLNSPSRTYHALAPTSSSATPGHSRRVPDSFSRSISFFTAIAAVMLSGMPELWPSPCPGAPSTSGIAIGDAGLLRALRDAVDVGAKRDHGLAAAPFGDPRGRDARDAARDLEAVLLEDAGEVARRLDLLKAQLAEAEHRVHHLLRQRGQAVDVGGGLLLQRREAQLFFRRRRRLGGLGDFLGGCVGWSLLRAWGDAGNEDQSEEGDEGACGH